MLIDRCDAEDFLKMVYISEILDPLALDEFAAYGRAGSIVRPGCLIVKFNVLSGIAHLREVAVELNTRLHVIVDLGISRLSALGGNENHTVGSAGTIDGS